jgi:hypothetical protein
VKVSDGEAHVLLFVLPEQVGECVEYMNGDDFVRCLVG